MTAADPRTVILQAAEEVRGWPEPYAAPLARWMEREAKTANRRHPGDVHPSLDFAREVLADSRRAARDLERSNARGR